MIAEGKLEFEIAWDGRRIVGAKVLSSRPVLASRVLEGKGIGEALRRVPLLFSIFMGSNVLDVYDPASGRLLRSVNEIGTTPMLLVTP